MSRLLPSLTCTLLLCAVCWSQSSAAPKSSAARDVSQPAVKDVAQPVAGEAAKDAKTSGAKEATPPSNIRLAVVERVVSKTETATGFSELSCDSDGNVYLGRADGDAIHKINAKGELAASFNPEANPDIDVLGVGHYAVTPEGEVYVAVGWKKSFAWHLLVFKKDGSYSTNIRPDAGAPMQPATISVFPNGNLLLTGTKLDRASKLFIIPFTGIFRSDGKLLKEITLEQDERLPDTSAMKNLKPGQVVPVISNRAVSWGQAEPAKDGNIYIMRWASPAKFYAISPGGEVVKRFEVDPGSSAYDPEQMHISGNRIAVMFRTKGADQIMKIVDLDGQELASYEISRAEWLKTELLGAFACYNLSPERFTFLISDTDFKLKIKHVEAR